MAQAAQSSVFIRFLMVLAASSLAMSTAHADDLRHKPKKERSLPSAGETLAPATDESTTIQPSDVKPGLAGSFLSGRFAKHNQDLSEAARYLNDTLAHDPNNEALQHETMRMDLLAGDTPGAIILAKKLGAGSGNDPLVACLLMLDSVKANDFARAKSVIEQTSSAGLFGLIRPVMLQWLAIAAEQAKGPADMHAAIDKAGFFAPFLNYHTALMDDVMGQNAAAMVAFNKANIDPAVTPYRVVEAIANFQARQGKWDDAQATYDAYAKANPQSSLIPEKLDRSQPPAPLVADAKQGLAELFFTTASILFGEDATQDTFLYLRIALELRPDLPPAQLMLANLYEQVEDYKQAIATYDSIPDGSVFARRAQVRKALNYEALGQKDKAISLLEAIAAKYPNDATALITKGDMEREAQKYSDAAETYTQAIKRTEPLDGADWPLLYARGISYERAGDWKSAEADFNRALQLQPDQPDVLNYLAYSWLTMNKNVPQARQYLETALAARPDDAHIIDSVGWADYLAGNYAGAVEKFEKAIELMPDDPTVNEHLGDAYFRVGRDTEARYQWERALTFKPDKDVADSLRNKLANGLPAATVQPAQESAKTTTVPDTSAVTKF